MTDAQYSIGDKVSAKWQIGMTFDPPLIGVVVHRAYIPTFDWLYRVQVDGKDVVINVPEAALTLIEKVKVIE